MYFGENAGAHGRAETDDAPTIARNDVRTKLRRLATAGARGIGELRPESSGYDLANSDEADLLAWAAAAFDLPVLVHASEPVGHQYPGKHGLALESLYAFARAQSGVTIIAAHWGGGLPFYALMPEVRDALESMYFDTAASHLLYDPAIYRRVIDLVGVEKILWASDYPLTSQEKALERTRARRTDGRRTRGDHRRQRRAVAEPVTRCSDASRRSSRSPSTTRRSRCGSSSPSTCHPT